MFRAIVKFVFSEHKEHKYMFGVFIFIVICVGSLVIYKTFFKGKFESMFGMFALKWFLWTLILAVLSCTVVNIEPTENESGYVEQQR